MSGVRANSTDGGDVAIDNNDDTARGTNVRCVLDQILDQGLQVLRRGRGDARPALAAGRAEWGRKSNFIQVFELLGEIIRGGLVSSTSAWQEEASALLHSASRTAERIEIDASFASNGYEVSLVLTDDDELIFEREVPWFIDRPRYERPYTVPLGSGHRESRLPESHENVAKWVLRRMSDWFVYHFHDTSRRAPVKLKGSIDDNDALRDDASNLAAFLYRLRETDRVDYDPSSMPCEASPFFDDFRLRPDRLNPDRIQLEWAQRGSTATSGNAPSDGTLRFICIATLLLQPEPPSLILLDEPVPGLHVRDQPRRRDARS